MIDTKASPLAAPQLYTDVNGVANLHNRDPEAQIEEVARQFESMMMQMMLQSMRQANAVFAEGNPLSSSETQFYQDMFDHQLSLTLGQQGGMGLSAALKRQLGAKVGIETPAGVDAAADTSLQRLAARSAAAPIAADNPLIEQMLARLPTLPQRAQPDPSGVVPAAFDGTPADFVAAVAPLAERAAGELGVDGRVLVSQAALETGWGRKVLQRPDGSSSYNFFNIKAGSSWQGDVVKVPTLEYRDGVAVRETAAFRAYASPAEGFADYVRLIRDNPRYRDALQRAGDPGHYMQALADAGYATDPAYAQKVMQVLGTDHVQEAAKP